MGLEIDFSDIHVCMLTNNEELLLEQSLISLKEFFPKFFFLDQSSSDRTVQIINDILGKRATVIIEPEEYIREIGFSGARNRVSDLCNSPWILHVDADEVISLSTSHSSVIAEFADPEANFSAVVRHNLQRVTDLEFPITPDQIALLPVESVENHIRLYRNNVGIRWRSFIHEELWQGDKRLPHETPRCNILLNHLSRFKSFDAGELKEEFYGWMMIRGFKSPQNKEEKLSDYSLHVLREREEYFLRMAQQYESRLGH